MAGLVDLVCPRTGSWSTLFASRTDWWRSTGTSFKTRSRAKSQPAVFQCSAERFPPDDLPRGICASRPISGTRPSGNPSRIDGFSDLEEYTTTHRTIETRSGCECVTPEDDG